MQVVNDYIQDPAQRCDRCGGELAPGMNAQGKARCLACGCGVDRPRVHCDATPGLHCGAMLDCGGACMLPPHADALAHECSVEAHWRAPRCGAEADCGAGCCLPAGHLPWAEHRCIHGGDCPG